MTFRTPNLDLPYIAPAQAQKHVTHNEAIRALDAVVQLSVTTILDTPPTNPVNGERFIVGTDPDSEFLDHPNEVAAFQDGAWTFLTPQEGWRVYDNTAKDLYVFSNAGWASVLPEQLPQEFADQFGVNASADDFNRLVVKSEASLFDHVGAGHQLKVNKADDDKTASLLFQSNYQGHAEMGLTGSNDFALRVSEDGVEFNDTMRVSHLTGDVSFENGTHRDRLLPTVANTGNQSEFYGFPNLSTIATSQGSITLTSNRVYFCPIYVDRPTEITGGLVVVSSAASDSAAVMRIGVFDVGEAVGNSWQIGSKRADFGRISPTTAGGLDFTTDTPVLLERGWYMFALGVNSPSIAVRYLLSYTAGLCQFALPTATQSDFFRCAGPSIYCFINERGPDIQNGFPQDWDGTLATDVGSTSFRSYTFFVPKFRHWNAP